MSNPWLHPVITALMEGRAVQDECGCQYVQENSAVVSSQMKTLSDNNLDVLAVQLAEWCMKIPGLRTDVGVISNFLFVLNKMERSEDFHRQCCQLTCCLAKEVMKLMQQSCFPSNMLRIASEIFLLQDLLNPHIHCCTKDLLSCWLSIQKEENLSGDLICENINKMLGVVEEFNTLCTFVEAIFNVFSSRFLPLCTDLSLRIFQSQRQLTSAPAYVASPNCSRLIQVVEIVGKLFRNFTPLYSECLLTSLTLDPTLPRYISTLNFFLGRTSGVPVSACKMLPVDIKIYNSVLQTIGQLRPIQLDRQQSWTHLRHFIIGHLVAHGYSLDESGDNLGRHGSPVDEAELSRKLMVKEEREASLMPVGNLSAATTKFGGLPLPKARSTSSKPGGRRQATAGRGQRRDLLTKPPLVVGPGRQQQGSCSSSIATAANNSNAGKIIVINNINQTTATYHQSYLPLPGESQTTVVSSSSPPSSLSNSSSSADVAVQLGGGSQSFAATSSSDVTSTFVEVVALRDAKVVNNVTQQQQVAIAFPEPQSKCQKAGTTDCVVSLENIQQGGSGRRGTGRTPSRSSPRRLSTNNNDSGGIKYEDEDVESLPVSKRLRNRSSHSDASSSVETVELKATVVANNVKIGEDGKQHLPRRGRPPKNSKTNGSFAIQDEPCLTKQASSVTSSFEVSSQVGNRDLISKKGFNIARKLSFFNLRKYRRKQKPTATSTSWIKNRLNNPRSFINSKLKKGNLTKFRRRKGLTSSAIDLPSCFVSLPKLSSSEVTSKRVLRKRKFDSVLDVNEEIQPAKRSSRRGSDKPRVKTAPVVSQAIPVAGGLSAPSIIASEVAAAKPCVCDGCGEVVPDCSWLTAHIVVCPGMTGGGTEEDVENDMMVSPDDSWTIHQQPKIEQQQEQQVLIRPVPAQDGREYVQQQQQQPDEIKVYNDYDIETVKGERVNVAPSDANFASFAPHQTYVLSPQAPVSFGKEVVVDGVAMFEFNLNRCSHCSLSFYTEASLSNHLKASDHFYAMNAKYDIFVCPKCGLHFSEKSTLWLHSQYSCSQPFGSESNQSTSASTVAGKETYKCWICQKEFLSELFLARHVLGKHAADSVAFQCLHQQLLQHKKQQVQFQGQYQVAKNQGNYSNLVQSNGTSAISTGQTRGQMINGSTVVQGQLSTVDASHISADIFQQATCELYQSSASLLYSQSDTYPQTQVNQTGGFYQQQQQQEFSTVSVLPIAMSENQDMIYNLQSQQVNSSDIQSALASAGSAGRVQGAGGLASLDSSFSAASAPQNETGGVNLRRAAKGIMYKNVYMQCVVNYHCSHCKTDLSTKALKKEHRRSACFDANSNRFSYLRQYSYLCPYCGEKFPSQKVCRQHQLSVCLVLMGVKTDELNFKQHNCPFCQRKYFNVITLKGHLTLSHKEQIDSTNAEAAGLDADECGNEEGGGKYSNFIINNPLVPIPNLEAGPVFSVAAMSPLKAALQQQQLIQQQQQLQAPPQQIQEQLGVPESPIIIEDGKSSTGSAISNNPPTSPLPQAAPSFASRSKVSRRRVRGKSPVIHQGCTSATMTVGAGLTRSLRSNPRSSRYHYDDDFCSGEDLDVFEPRPARGSGTTEHAALRSDRQTRSSVKGGERGSRNKIVLEDEDDSDATDDLTVDESVNDVAEVAVSHQMPEEEEQQQLNLMTGRPIAEPAVLELSDEQHQLSKNFINIEEASLNNIANNAAQSNDQQIIMSMENLKNYAASEAVQSLEAVTNLVTNLESVALDANDSPLLLENVTTSADTRGVSVVESLVPSDALNRDGDGSQRSHKNRFIIENLLGESKAQEGKFSETIAGATVAGQGSENGSDLNDDFLINVDSSLDGGAEDDEASVESKTDSANSAASRPATSQGQHQQNPPADTGSIGRDSPATFHRSGPRCQKSTTGLFSTTYEKTSRSEKRDSSFNNSAPLNLHQHSGNRGSNQTVPENLEKSPSGGSESNPKKIPAEDAKVIGEDEDGGSVERGCPPDVVMDVKKRTILKKLSNSLIMANKRQQPSTIGSGGGGGNRFLK